VRGLEFIPGFDLLGVLGVLGVLGGLGGSIIVFASLTVSAVRFLVLYFLAIRY